MTSPNTILEEIFEHKQAEVAQRKKSLGDHTIRLRAAEQNPPLDFFSALKQAKLALIAEIKRASPSKGEFGLKYSASELAQLYAAHGAAAISVLTDERYFRGSLEDLRAVAQLPQRVPLLQKDFLCDPYQVYEARAYGADAVLLIASYLDFGLMQELHDLATELGMAALVEVHTARELEKALRLRGLRIIGVNNRNLHDFSVNLRICLELRPHVPSELLLVAESGIQSADDIRLLIEHGITAFLVGEALVRSGNPAQTLREFLLEKDESKDLRH
ncbi:MAG: indole-3-glycerol phosphate synthase TrpC [Anaerolineales bacterium]|nr:indole-3-glycerol phosphate synthase TrpC [Anaerolineales bacterium]MDW8446522.1 indole-3-glycerol phosphate synthase TrpC [Anaerolineales bacterium]